MRRVSGSMEDGGNEATTILVTPVWKDARRLAAYGRELAAELSKRRLPVRWIIADDGSGPIEREVLEKLRDEYAETWTEVRCHFADAHRGKGSVVREAWALEPDAGWYAFVDADGSVTAGDMLDLIEKATTMGRSALGIRKETESTHVEEDLLRRVRHYGFLAAAHWIVDVRSDDTQCGAKVLKGTDYRQVAESLQENGLAFDVELLAELAAAGFEWDEVPVNWSRKGGSRVRPWKDAAGMLAALFRIRNRMRPRM